jgi:hypothetical protein
MSRAPLGSSSPESPADTDTRFRNGFTNGVRLTWNPHRYYGYELGYFQTQATVETKIQATAAGSKQTFQGKATLQQAFFDILLYWMPKNERWRPYFAGGAQAQQAGNPRGISDWTGYSTRNYGVHYGGGIKLKLMNHVLVRADLRQYLTGKPYDLHFAEITKAGGVVRQEEASVGIAFGF